MIFRTEAGSYRICDRKADANISEGMNSYPAGYEASRSISFSKQIAREGSGKILERELRAPSQESRDRAVA